MISFLTFWDLSVFCFRLYEATLSFHNVTNKVIILEQYLRVRN